MDEGDEGQGAPRKGAVTEAGGMKVGGRRSQGPEMEIQPWMRERQTGRLPGIVAVGVSRSLRSWGLSQRPRIMEEVADRSGHGGAELGSC